MALDLTTATNVGFLVALPVVFAPLSSLTGASFRLIEERLPWYAPVQ